MEKKDGPHAAKSKVVKEEALWTGKWLKVEQTTYLDPKGQIRTWETVKRTTRSASCGSDGVAIMAILKRTLHHDCLLLVKQFRPPMGCYTIELPAGLVDSGETVQAAALRELQEETGYHAEITGVSPVLCLDPGISNCTELLVSAVINGDDPENRRPQQELEFIEVLLVPVNELLQKLTEMSNKGIVVDARVHIYAMALVQATAKPNLLPLLKA
ncbi:ADP-sugar pyrophosphatase isoform X1 [Lethenteron reissneri]|uniref:ADP-sugar pyrophosphatase isoform X1 n=1 Tax=Lethenteron reissneri TaxID=7753 RepID=UPI002AB7187B|nr:ADP-sugar pyrophosphatase isoform X1 [Lethenteron reissneri]XP_061418971.1 ADP-sugar pyrophosphatase isoform X1 [Lethenteron reissneri]XP_061418972.1 ADP-sugar pyrophosphatase isoform X1 [Lethenteron reissneri]